MPGQLHLTGTGISPTADPVILEGSRRRCASGIIRRAAGLTKLGARRRLSLERVLASVGVMPEVLVLSVGLPERSGRADLGHHLTRPEPRAFGVSDHVLGDSALLITRV